MTYFITHTHLDHKTSTVNMIFKTNTVEFLLIHHLLDRTGAELSNTLDYQTVSVLN